MSVYVEICDLLARFYKLCARDLPWRNNPDAYRVWISEVMLQQTQVETVKGYFERWMRRFPDIPTLAEATEEDVYALWAGLGYYRRAANIHRAAQMLCELYDGELPKTRAELLTVPGIGEYTASAVCAFAYGQREAPIDGNVERVLSRLFDIEKDIVRGEGKKSLGDHAAILAQAGDASVTFQAVMDLASSHCKKGGNCELCPLKDLCLAKKRNCVELRPVKIKNIKRRTEIRCGLKIRDKAGNIFMIRRPKNELLGALWEIPFLLFEANENCDHERFGKDLPRQVSLFFDGIPFSDADYNRCFFKHVLTHVDMWVNIAEFYVDDADALQTRYRLRRPDDDTLWTKSPQSLSHSTLMRKVFDTPHFNPKAQKNIF